MAKLPKPKFNLRVAKATTPTLISLVFRYRGKRIVYSTGYSVHPKDWDFKAQRPIIQQRRPDLIKVKRQLDDLSFYCTNIFIESNYGLIEPGEFKNQLDIKMGRIKLVNSNDGEANSKPDFWEFLDLELEDMHKQGMREGSWDAFNRHANILKRFAKEVRHFDYDDVDWNLRLEIIDWLASRNIKLAYGNKTISILRQFMERARRKKLHSNVEYQGTGWIIPQKKAVGQKVILTEIELQRLQI